MSKIARAPGASTGTSTPEPAWLANYKSSRENSPDKLDRIQELAARLRDKEMEREDLKEQLKAVNIEIEKIQRQDLPELFVEAKMTRFDLDADGNNPPKICQMSDDVYANISAEWPQAQRDTGFATVRELGGEDTIKNTITISCGRKTDKLAQRILNGIKRLLKENPDADIYVEPKEKIQHQTLSAWLRMKVEMGEEPTNKQLENIGGRIGKIVKIKDKPNG